jgi:hypothetical protein
MEGEEEEEEAQQALLDKEEHQFMEEAEAEAEEALLAKVQLAACRRSQDLEEREALQQCQVRMVFFQVVVAVVVVRVEGVTELVQRVKFASLFSR